MQRMPPKGKAAEIVGSTNPSRFEGQLGLDTGELGITEAHTVLSPERLAVNERPARKFRVEQRDLEPGFGNARRGASEA
jgi:hypothetical protein